MICAPCEAQFGFALRAQGIQTHERAANTPSEPRSARGVEKRTPHHVARNRETDAEDRNVELACDGPQDAQEAKRKHQSLKQSDRCCQIKSPQRLVVVASVHEQPVPLFQ